MTKSKQGPKKTSQVKKKRFSQCYISFRFAEFQIERVPFKLVASLGNQSSLQTLQKGQRLSSARALD